MEPLFAVERAKTSGLQNLINGIQQIGDLLLAIAPGLIVLSFAAAALMWVMAGSSARLARMARDQFVATCVVCVIIGGYFVLRMLARGLLGAGQFG